MGELATVGDLVPTISRPTLIALVLALLLPAIPADAAQRLHEARRAHDAHRQRSDKHRTPCRDRRRLVIADRQAEIAIVGCPGEKSYAGRLRRSKHFYLFGTNLNLITHSYSETTSQITLSGRYVSYEVSTSVSDFVNEEPASSTNVVYVLDLRTGRTIHKSPTSTRLHPSRRYIGVGATSAIVLKPDGAVAWIAHTVSEEEGGYQVHAVDKSGSRELAVGPDIAPQSLALAGSTLYWTQGGVPHTATLE